MGKTGFVIVAAAALLATTSAINATLFSAFNITDRMCSTGILPDSWGKTVFRQGTTVNILLILLTLLLALFLNLSDLANVASFTFLLCYLMVLVVAWRQSAVIRASKLITGTGIVLVTAVLAGFVVTLLSGGFISVSVIAGALILCLFAGYLRKRSRKDE